MTLTQTYFLAHIARAKLSKEASKADHDLRLLVGHANLLDGLMLDLAEAEREQESWFNQTVSSSTTSTSPQASSNSNDRHVRWAESLPAVTEDYEEGSDDSSDDDEAETAPATVHKAQRPYSLKASPSSSSTITVNTTAIVDDDDDDDDDDMAEDLEASEELRLRRTPSHSSPPELMEECESESESDSDSDMPPSPPAPEIEAFAAADSNSSSSKPRRDAFAAAAKPPPAPPAPQEAFYEDGFYLPQRQPVSVY